MSLQNIKFSKETIGTLYRDYLILGTDKEEEITIPVTEPQKKLIKFLGGNNRQVAILVDSPDHVFLSDKQLQWLEKMLAACHLNMNDVAIINQAIEKVSLSQLKEQLSSSIVLLLGPSPSSVQLPIFSHFSLYQHEGCIFLFAPSPANLLEPTTEGKLLKSKLWTCLQELFKL